MQILISKLIVNVRLISYIICSFALLFNGVILKKKLTRKLYNKLIFKTID